MGSSNILYVASSGLTAHFGGGWTRISGEAKAVKRRGFSVQILCFVPPQHIAFKSKFVAAAKSSLEREAQSCVYFVPRLPLTRISTIHWLNDWYSAVFALLFSFRNHAKVVHCHGIGPARWGVMAKKICGKIKVIVDVHGASAEEYMYEKNLKYKDKMAQIIERQEFLTLKEADWIIFVSQSMKRYYEEKCQISLRNSSVIPCATDSTFVIDGKRREELRRENDLSGKIVFCYVGSGETYQLPGVMCQLFAEILGRFPNSFFLILSNHPDVFLKHLEAAGVDPIHYRILSVEHEQVFDLLQMGDIGFLLRDSSIVNRVASPTKFAEYLLCGLPVIITDFVGDFSEMVKQHRLGYIVDLNDLKVDVNLANFIKEVQQKRMEYADRCSSFAKKFLSWEIYGDVLAEIYNTLAEK